MADRWQRTQMPLRHRVKHIKLCELVTGGYAAAIKTKHAQVAL